MSSTTRTAVLLAVIAVAILPLVAAFADEKAVTVSLNINAMSTGDDTAHERLADDTRRLLEKRLGDLDGLEVVRANADLLLNVSVVQVDGELYTCSSMSFAYSPACIGLVLFETGIFGKQTGLARIVDLIVKDFEANTLGPYTRTRAVH